MTAPLLLKPHLRDWAAQRMGTIPGETEWIQLPG